MKHQFLKSALILGSVLAFVNCTDEATDVIGSLDPTALQPSENDPSAVPADDPHQRRPALPHLPRRYRDGPQGKSGRDIRIYR